mmetsp:Transcript_23397/g.57550  ORF Transcript_23397/g.57550 Transcript_23397/m.57550 type:complete len:94 (+) Transcript_23397:1392-1673(+)
MKYHGHEESGFGSEGQPLPGLDQYSIVSTPDISVPTHTNPAASRGDDFRDDDQGSHKSGLPKETGARTMMALSTIPSLRKEFAVWGPPSTMRC